MDTMADGWLEWMCLQLPGELWVVDVAVDLEGHLHCICSEEPYGGGVTALQYVADGWVPQKLPDERPLTAFGTAVDGSLIAVGREGVCIVWSESGWHRHTPPSLDLRRVWGTSAGNIYAVGSDFVALLDDSQWRVFKQTTGELGSSGSLEVQLADVHGLPGGPIWSVGADQSHSVILRLEGGAWFRGEGCESWNLHRVKVISPTSVVAAGEGGVFQRPYPPEPNERGHVVWERISSRAPRSFTGTDIVSRDGTPLVVGIAVLAEPQAVLLWEPDRWIRVRPPTDARITSARVVPTSLLAVGTRGAVWTTGVDGAMAG